MPNDQYPEHAGRPMVSTKHTDRGLKNSADDEPVFTLCARDLTADDTIQFWIEKNVDRLGPTHPKILSAIATRDAMVCWHPRKLPD